MPRNDSKQAVFLSLRAKRSNLILWHKILKNTSTTIKCGATQGHKKGVKDFISVLMLYKDHSSDDMETAVELALETKVSSSEGVRHILVYLVTESDFSPPPLETWPVLPPADLSPYGEPGGIV